MTDPSKIRNVAIIAHVDHGKTTMVDQLFRQSGLFRENQAVEERLMDSMDLEKERGITISAKNGCFYYKEHTVNIIDTPGHADFGGQVERVLQMADGVILLVDAQEGPMPQTYFVLRKALLRALPVIVVLNKIDKPAARPTWVLDQVFDLFVKLDAPHEILDFHTLYASATGGYASPDPSVRSGTVEPLLQAILDYVPPPKGDVSGPLQLQVSSIDYSPFLGRLGIGKITSGSVKMNDAVAIATLDTAPRTTRVLRLYKFEGNRKVETPEAGLGELIAVAATDEMTIGDTFTSVDNPIPMPTAPVDPPTLEMNFLPNNSPFASTEGQFCTSQHLQERLRREALADVALKVAELTDSSGFKVSGRGELHLSILIEKMRREGYEFQVSCPRVLYRDVDGVRHEPYEELTVDVADAYMGTVIENIGQRKGQMIHMSQENGMTRLVYKVPTRGLLGFKSEFMSETKGMGVLSYRFLEYDVYAGDMKNRKNGAIVSMEGGMSVAYALFNLQKRGDIFIGPGVKLYIGQIVGEHCRDNDLYVNPAKGKQLTNMRASGSDENIILTPPRPMSLEDCITFINEDELVEVTPQNVRLRKAPGFKIK